MKKASSILLTIAFIVNLIAAIACIVAGFVMVILVIVAPAYLPMSEIAIGIEEAFADMEIEIDEQMLTFIVQAVIALVYFLIFAVGFIACLIVAIIAKKGANAKRQGILIANIVFGILLENILVLIGGILGVIALKQDARRAARPAPQPQPKPAPVPAPAPVIEQKPEPEPEPEPEPASEDEVEPQPVEEPVQDEPKPARKDWFCPNCGAHNEGKFCQSCGTKKPE